MCPSSSIFGHELRAGVRPRHDRHVIATAMDVVSAVVSIGANLEASIQGNASDSARTLPRERTCGLRSSDGRISGSSADRALNRLSCGTRNLVANPVERSWARGGARGFLQSDECVSVQTPPVIPMRGATPWQLASFSRISDSQVWSSSPNAGCSTGRLGGYQRSERSVRCRVGDACPPNIDYARAFHRVRREDAVDHCVERRL
jgi:hypothetical protein